MKYYTDVPITVQQQLTSHGMKLPIAPMVVKPSSTIDSNHKDVSLPNEYIISFKHASVQDTIGQYRSIHNEIHLVKLSLRCLLGILYLLILFDFELYVFIILYSENVEFSSAGAWFNK